MNDFRRPCLFLFASFTFFTINESEVVVRQEVEETVMNDPYFILSISWSISSFCSDVRERHFENNSCWSFESSTSVPSEKNCTRLIPNESQMTCNVLILGSVLRLNIFEMVDMESPDSFAKTVFAPSMALHQFCYALFYVHQIHLLIILYVSTEKKIVAKSIVLCRKWVYW